MSDEHRVATERLAALVGPWRTTGSTQGTDATPTLAIDAVDTYEWVSGRWAVLHRVDARVGDQRVEGAEIIGWDPATGAYKTLYFGSDGPNSYEASLEEEAGKLVWRMHSQSDRFTGTFSEDRSRIDGHWEQHDDQGNWQPWMTVSLTREAA
jgi:hypothetical protein